MATLLLKVTRSQAQQTFIGCLWTWWMENQYLESPFWSRAAVRTVCAATPARAAQQTLKSDGQLSDDHGAMMTPHTAIPAMALQRRTALLGQVPTWTDALRLLLAQWLKRIPCLAQSRTWPSPLLPFPQSQRENWRRWCQTCLKSSQRGCPNSKPLVCITNENHVHQDSTYEFGFVQH